MVIGGLREGGAGPSFGISRIDWRSALIGGTAALLVAYVAFVRPSQRQLSMLERNVTRLTEAIDRLNGVGDDIDKGTDLLARLEAQGARLTGAEAALDRFEDLRRRLAERNAEIDLATAAFGRIESLHDAIVAHADRLNEASSALSAIENLVTNVAETRDAVVTSSEAIDTLSSRFDDSLAFVEGDLARIEAVAERISRIVTEFADADAALVSMEDLRDDLASAVGTIDGIRRFMVDVVLLEPAVQRAVRSIEPVIEFTRAKRPKESSDSEAASSRAAVESETATSDTPVVGVARAFGEEAR